MEDKDFLGYFTKLGPPSTIEEIRSSASKIVSTLVAIGSVPAGRRTSMDSTAKAQESAEQALKAKYS